MLLFNNQLIRIQRQLIILNGKRKFSNSIIKSANHKLIKQLPYDRSKIYSVIVDVKSYPEFIPYCLSTKILDKPSTINFDEIQREIDENSMSNKIQDSRNSSPITNSLGPEEFQVLTKIGYKGFITDYHSHVLCTPLERVEVIAKPSSTFSKLKTTWKLSNKNSTSSTLSATTGNTTQVELDLSFKFKNPVHEFLLSDELVWNKFSSLVIKAFEDRLASLN